MKQPARFITRTKSIFNRHDRRKRLLQVLLPIFFILLFAAAVLALLYGFGVLQEVV